MMDEKSSSQFIDLLAYQHVNSSGRVARSNLIKARNVACSGVRTVEVNGQTEDAPTVIAHRDGDVITAIEFICPCGHSTTVSLEY